MAVNISNALSASGHEVMVVVGRSGRSLQNKLLPEIEIVYLEKKSFLDFSAFYNLLKSIKRFRPKVIHAHSSSIIWGIFSKVMSSHPFKLVFHDHYGMSEMLKENDRSLLRILSGNIDCVIAVNEKLLVWNSKYLKVPTNKIVYLRNFPHLVMPNKSANKGVIQILCLANLRQQKDHPTLIKAFALLIKNITDHDIRLVLAGNIASEIYLKEVEDLIANLSLSNLVEIMGAVENVEELLINSDVGVLSSVSEGLPVSLLEYGLAGLPVVVTEVGDCRQVVANGKYGVVVSPGRPQELAEGLIYLIEKRKIAINMGLEFKKHVEENYGSEGFLKSYFRLVHL